MRKMPDALAPFFLLSGTRPDFPVTLIFLKPPLRKESVAMNWEYLVKEVSAGSSDEALGKLLSDADFAGWEAFTSLAIPGDPHINRGASRTVILFKKTKSE